MTSSSVGSFIRFQTPPSLPYITNIVVKDVPADEFSDIRVAVFRPFARKPPADINELLSGIGREGQVKGETR